MKGKNVTARIGEKFSAELEEIKEARLKSGIDKKRKSTRKLTDLFTTHKSWERIKQEAINLDNEKFNKNVGEE